MAKTFTDVVPAVPIGRRKVPRSPYRNQTSGSFCCLKLAVNLLSFNIYNRGGNDLAKTDLNPSKRVQRPESCFLDNVLILSTT